MNKLYMIVLTVTLGACGGSVSSRHTMTDKDVAAVKDAQDHQQTTWTDVEQTVHALTCILNSGPPFNICYIWKRNPPAGAFDCTGETVAYSGEFLFSDVQNFNDSSTNCAGYNHNSSPGGLASLGDYNDVAVAVKNNSGVEIHGYRDANFGQNVQFFPTNGQTITNLSSPYNTQMSSFRH